MNAPAKIKWPAYRVVCPVPARDGETYYTAEVTEADAIEARDWADEEQGWECCQRFGHIIEHWNGRMWEEP